MKIVYLITQFEHGKIENIIDKGSDSLKTHKNVLVKMKAHIRLPKYQVLKDA